MTSKPLHMLYIPDTLKYWPWKKIINPHYKEVQAESAEWFSKFLPQLAELGHGVEACEIIRKCDRYSFLTLYPPHRKVPYNILRVTSDFSYFGFLVDHFTDCQPPPVVREFVTIISKILRNPQNEYPESGNFFVQLTKELSQSILKFGHPNATKHFLDSVDLFLDSLILEAEMRKVGTVLTPDAYFVFRHANACGWPLFAQAEMAFNIPEEVYLHPVVREIENLTMNLLTIDNDLCSYAREYAMYDEGCNILSVIMQHENISLEAAVGRVSELHKADMDRLLYLFNNLPMFPDEAKKELQQYLTDGVLSWVRGNNCWSFAAGRYFGDKGPEIEVTRLVTLCRGDTDFKPTKLEI